ncbi:hypothetical protein [Streptomyces rochei]|uniref:hypothetical protein n=1 Tax=Streptomyces rochei TaxID=1928 RepID=UPI0036FA5265
MPSGTFRFEPNPRMFNELARSREMRDTLLDVAQRGAAATRVIAPSYSGPTYKPGVSRHGEYKDSIYAVVNLNPNGWRSEYGATAPWALQVEFGTGDDTTRRRGNDGRFRSVRGRPQGGYSPKFRPLGRSLDSLRSTA